MEFETKNIASTVILIILIFGYISFYQHKNAGNSQKEIDRLRQRIDSVSSYYSDKMEIYEEHTYVLDSIIKLSNEDYEEAVEHYWDSIAINTDDSTFNSELSDFLEDMANRRR